MKEEFRGHTIEVYDSAETMPMKRYQRFNKMLMIANEVGSDFTDFDLRSRKAIEFLKKEMYPQAINELENRRQQVYNSFMEYTPKGRAFAICVKSIDGVEYKDISKSGLDEICDKLDEIGYPYGRICNKADEVKKKSKKNSLRTFLRNLIKRNPDSTTPKQ